MSILVHADLIAFPADCSCSPKVLSWNPETEQAAGVKLSHCQVTFSLWKNIGNTVATRRGLLSATVLSRAPLVLEQFLQLHPLPITSFFISRFMLIHKFVPLLNMKEPKFDVMITSPKLHNILRSTIIPFLNHSHIKHLFLVACM